MRTHRSSSICGLILGCALTASALAGAAGNAVGGGAQPAELPAATSALLARYPGTHLAYRDDRISHIYGMPMTSGATPDDAADAFLARHIGAFGLGRPTLEMTRTGLTSAGKFTSFSYAQTIDDLPVEYSNVRLLVLNEGAGEPNRVVYAAADLADPTAPTLKAAVTVTPAQALASAQQIEMYAGLQNWSEPELAIFKGEHTPVSPVKVWKFSGEEPVLSRYEKYTFFVDASTGQIVHVRDDVYNVDVIGSVKGWATPGTTADRAANPPTLQNMGEIRVKVTGGNQAFANLNGDFTIAHGGATPVTVTSNILEGAIGGIGSSNWVEVQNDAGAELAVSGSFTPGVAGTLTYNVGPTEFNTAQVNAFIHTNLIHNYFTDRSGAFGALNLAVTANTNIASTCNAFYTGTTINFYRSGGGCNNTAFTTVVAHEYGHFVVNQLGLAQGAFGEGFGDICSELLYDTPVLGEFFFTGGGSVRNSLTSTRSYPCSGEVHDCGEVLANVWWDIRENFGATHGSGAGLEMTRQLHVDWADITLGGSGSNSAHPTTAIEVLTTDDNDGNINNGTPNYSDICQAFGEHGISCPPLSLIAFSYPDGIPSNVTPNTPETFRVNVTPLSGTPTPGTGILHYRVGAVGPFTPVGMNQTSPNMYEATLPGTGCTNTIQFYVSAVANGSTTVNDPSSGQNSAVSASGLITLAAEDFEASNAGFAGSTQSTGGTVTGAWNRMNPQGTAAQPEDDHTPNPGVNCWVTDGNAGASLGDFDVDNGYVRLTSPAFDLSGTDGVVSYWRWYSNTTGADPNNDVFDVEVSNNNGTTWVLAERVGPSGTGTNGGWFSHSFKVGDFVTPTSTVRVRFVASDLGSGSLVEAAMDDLEVETFDCTVTSCAADLATSSPLSCGTPDGVLNTDDFVCYLGLYSAGNASADVSNAGVCGSGGDGVINTDDFVCYLQLFATGCP